MPVAAPVAVPGQRCLGLAFLQIALAEVPNAEAPGLLDFFRRLTLADREQGYRTRSTAMVFLAFANAGAKTVQAGFDVGHGMAAALGRIIPKSGVFAGKVYHYGHH